MNKMGRKVLLIGLDAAEWKVVDDLIARGEMPTMAAFLKEASYGKIATLDPPISPMLWTSMATGKRADKHGIHGFIEPDPDPNSLNGVRPVSSTSRKVKAIWNILNQHGLKSNVVGWWPSHPAEPINGCMVSHFYQQSRKKVEEEWPMLQGTVHPERLTETLKEFRMHPEEITSSHIAPFVPDFRFVNPKKDRIMGSLLMTLAHASSIHNAATYLIENEPWDFMAVYHDSIDHFSHAGMKFRPPRLSTIPEEQFRLYKDVVDSAYRFTDMMLERMLQLAGPDTTVMIVSDHGFHSDHLRPKYLPQEPAGPTYEHSPYGFFAIRGPGIKKNNRIFGGSVIDITPTLLSLYNLPVAKDMEGKPLVQIYEEPVQVGVIDSWENVPGEDGMHKENTQDPWAEQEALNQLIELGYVEELSDDKSKNIKIAQNEGAYYVARNLIDGRRYKDALPLLETLYENNKDNKDTLRYSFRLINLYMSMNMTDKAMQLLNELRQHFPEGSDPSLDYAEGLLHIALHNPRRAEEFFQKVLVVAPGSVNMITNVGLAYLVRQEYKIAKEYFAETLSIDKDNIHALQGLGVTLMKEEKYEEALDEFLKVIDNTYYHIPAHQYIGECLYQLELKDKAAEAFEVAAVIGPHLAKTRRWLIRIYEELGQIDKAEKHRMILNEKIKGEIIIVSGLPRSGTSVMMQMLDKGGIPVLTDERRSADQSNPKGYYEYEPVKKMAADNSWIKEANGKAVKIIAQLLPYLPSNFNYKIIFMEREMSEVMKSQQVMLGKTAEVKNNAFPLAIADVFSKQVKTVNDWMAAQTHIKVHRVNYKNLVANTREEAEKLVSFLDTETNIEEMISAVDPSLYRNKILSE
jgi:predicted AlkP superfamily phosphohydrolase/phosphomutase/tetratricopeptide (TPR) repeat protein